MLIVFWLKILHWHTDRLKKNNSLKAQQNLDLCMHTEMLSPALICISFPRIPPTVQGRDPACPPLSGKCWDLITASGRGIVCQSLLQHPTGTALLKPKDDWNVNCFQGSVSSLAWLKEKPQGIYLKADEDPPYARSKQTNSINFSRVWAFFPWKSESSESVLSSLVQPNMEKPTPQDGKLAMKYTVNKSKGAMTDIRITLLCLCSGRCRIPADH